MNIAEMLGVPVRDDVEIEDPTRSRCSVPAALGSPAQETGRRSGWLRLTLVGLAALTVGVGAGALLSPSPPVAARPAEAIVPAGTTPPNLGSFAEMVTALQLSGITDPADLAAMYSGTLTTTMGTGLWVNRSAAVATEPLGDEFWLVTVAIDALEMNDGAYESVGVQYYDLTIATAGDRAMAVSAPTRIPAPATGGPAAGVPTFGGPVPADQAVAVSAFLEAYLTGRGEVARYVSPTARILLFPEAPYETIRIGSLGSDSLGRVRAQVEAVTNRGGHQNLDYTLEMTFESGVWEVSDLVAAVDDRR